MRYGSIYGAQFQSLRPKAEGGGQVVPYRENLFAEVECRQLITHNLQLK